MKSYIPYNKQEPLPMAERTMDAFKDVFGSSVHIDIRTIGTTGIIHVPKQYRGCVVTLIVWPKREAYTEFEPTIHPSVREVSLPTTDIELPYVSRTENVMPVEKATEPVMPAPEPIGEPHA